MTPTPHASRALKPMTPECPMKRQQPITDVLPTIDPRHTALLVMDFQAGALGVIGEPEALPAVADAIAIVRDRSGHIASVRAGLEDSEYDAVPAHSMIAPFVAAGRAAHSESPCDRGPRSRGPRTWRHHRRQARVGALSTTDLDAQLRNRNITTLILAGITTSGVVLEAFAAHGREYPAGGHRGHLLGGCPQSPPGGRNTLGSAGAPLAPRAPLSTSPLWPISAAVNCSKIRRSVS